MKFLIPALVCLLFSACTQNALYGSNHAANRLPGNSVISTGSKLSSLLLTPTDCLSLRNCLPGAYLVKPGQDLFTLGQNIGTLQKYAQWTNQHYAILIAAGSYNMSQTFDLGYYTQVLGVSKDPAKAVVSPGIESLNQGHMTSGNWQTGSKGTPCPGGDKTDPYCLVIGGLNNFWRGLENLTLKNANPQLNHDSAPVLRWSVSQAAPLRNTIISGYNFLLCDYSTKTWACGRNSGGFMSNVKVLSSQISDKTVGNVLSASQQQWLTRSSDLEAGWSTGLWNMVFVGTSGSIATVPAPSPLTTPAPSNAPVNYPITQVATSPTPVREKPYLAYEQATEAWSMVVPGLRGSVTQGLDTASQGLISVNDDTFVILSTDKSSDPASTMIVSPSQIVAINSALASGKNLLVMPGVYDLQGTLRVPAASQRVILGIGFPVLVCAGTGPCMDISAEQGVLMGGIIFEAGYQSTPSLLQVGDSSNANDNHANPIFLFDIFARIAETQDPGRAQIRQTDTALIINSNNVVGDNLWLWRGDHDIASGTDTDPSKDLVQWNQNLAKHGLVVNGSQVTIYGLFVEHFQDFQTVWNGEKGTVYFYQSEMPYDVPSLPDWKCRNPMDSSAPSTGGCASYVVNSSVKEHTALGVGVYTYFANAPILAPSAVLAPSGLTPGFTNIVGRFLNGKENSGLKSLVNDYSSIPKCWGYKATCGGIQTADPVAPACLDPISKDNETPTLGTYPNASIQICGSSPY